jgi:hypothetical protein
MLCGIFSLHGFYGATWLYLSESKNQAPKQSPEVLWHASQYNGSTPNLNTGGEAVPQSSHY